MEIPINLLYLISGIGAFALVAVISYEIIIILRFVKNSWIERTHVLKDYNFQIDNP
jgi:hypothetical protein